MRPSIPCGSMIAMLVIAMSAYTQAPNAAPPGHVNDLVFHVADLVYRVDDMGGKIESLEVKETPTEVRIDLSADVLFAFDKADLLPKAQQTLSQAAAIIREKAKGAVRIDGYTDAKGSDAYNQRLSERRAAAVENWFKTRGISTLFPSRPRDLAPRIRWRRTPSPMGRTIPMAARRIVESRSRSPRAE
jgi:outer membrane protein OmpA-like peptidoglycan-associated protein